MFFNCCDANIQKEINKKKRFVLIFVISYE